MGKLKTTNELGLRGCTLLRRDATLPTNWLPDKLMAHAKRIKDRGVGPGHASPQRVEPKLVQLAQTTRRVEIQAAATPVAGQRGPWSVMCPQLRS